MRKKQLILVSLSASIILSACGWTSPDANQPPLPSAEELQNALVNGLEQYGGMGLAAAVIAPGYETWVGVAGESHPGTAITPDMVFDAGSTHKMYTAMVILQLVEEGVLSLDDPLSKWLPDYPNVDNQITIRQLLNHTGGVFDMVRHPDYWPAMTSEVGRIWQPEEILTNFLDEPYFTRGNSWHYSTPGYILLRMIIERATGEDLTTQYHSRLFEPLGLANTYLMPFDELPDATAHGWFDLDLDGAYDEINDGIRYFNSFNSSTSGAIYVTAEDLAKWSQAVFREGKVVSEQSLEEAMILRQTTPDEPLAAGYGLGILKFSPEVFNGVNLWGHSGNTAGYAAGCFYLPEYGVSLAIITNTHAGEPMPTAFDVLSILTGQLKPLDS
jgi:D-alanyl-D-alanine carboxypeptidase